MFALSNRTCLYLCCVLSVLLYGTIAWISWSDLMFKESRVVDLAFKWVPVALVAIYFAAIRFVRRATTRDVVAGAIALAVAGLAIGPYNSTDVFFYIAKGWQQVHYDADPYLVSLRSIPDAETDPMIGSSWMTLNRNPWLDAPLPYGFAFARLAHALTWLGDGSLGFTLVLFKLLNLTLHACTALILWRIAARIEGANAKLILYLYAWSPMVLLQFLANLHNDILMGALVLLALLLILKERTTLSMAALVIAGLVKYLAFAVVPLAAVLIYRRNGLRALVQSLAISLAIALILCFPYLEYLGQIRLWEVFRQIRESGGSLHAFLTYGWRDLAVFFSIQPHLEEVRIVTELALWAVAAALAFHQLRLVWKVRTPSPQEVALRWAAVLAAILFIGSPQFYVWYIGVVLPVALIGAESSLLTRIVFVLSGTHTALSFMRGKAEAYFLLATAFPVCLLLSRRALHKKSRAALPF